jgi:hypothetical protein
MNYQCFSSRLAAILVLMTIHSLVTYTAQAQINPEQASATISGRVTFSGNPARDIKVSLVPGPYGSPQTPRRQSVRTDEEGRYEFKGLAAGRYGIVAASYIYVRDDLFSMPTRPFKLCTVAAGDRLTGQDIRLVRGGVITRRVTDAEGKPVILERVHPTFVDKSGKRQDFSALLNDEMLETDDRGIYRLYGLPPGRYLISAGRERSGSTGSARGFHCRVYYPGVAEVERAEAIEVREGSEVTSIDLQLGPIEKTFAVSGRVVDAANGQAAPGAMTDFYLFNQQTHQWRTWTLGLPSNNRGEFHFAGLLPRRYGIAGTPDAMRNYYGELVAVEIKDEDLEGVEIKLQRSATISGTVVFDRVLETASILQHTSLWLKPTPLNPGNAMSRDLPFGQVQANGSFQLKALPPGKVGLELGGGEHSFSLLRIERNGVAQQDAFELRPGEQVTGVRVVLAQAIGALRGRVVLPSLLATDWLPEVLLRRADGGAQLERPIQLDASNSFLLPTLAIGEYEIVVTLTSKNSGDNQIPPEPLHHRVTVREGATTEVVLQVEPRR